MPSPVTQEDHSFCRLPLASSPPLLSASGSKALGSGSGPAEACAPGRSPRSRGHQVACSVLPCHPHEITPSLLAGAGAAAEPSVPFGAEPGWQEGPDPAAKRQLGPSQHLSPWGTGTWPAAAHTGLATSCHNPGTQSWGGLCGRDRGGPTLWPAIPTGPGSPEPQPRSQRGTGEGAEDGTLTAGPLEGRGWPT